MPEVTIQGGMKLQIPNMAEIRDGVRGEVGDAFAHQRKQMQAVKDLRRGVQLGTNAAATVSTLAGGTGAGAPASGYSWVVRLLTIQLASAGTVNAYISSDNSVTAQTATTLTRLLWPFTTSQTAQAATFPSGAGILHPDEGLLFIATQNITAYAMYGWEVPTEMLAELY